MDITAPRIHFLGIVARVYQKSELLDLLEVKTIKAFGQQMIDIGVVYKAEEIRKLIKFYLTSTVFSKLITDGLEVGEIDNEVGMDQLIESAIKVQDKASEVLESKK